MSELFTQNEATLVLLVGVFLGVLLAITGLAQVLQRGENRQEARNRRLKMLAKGATPQAVLDLLKPPVRHSRLSVLRPIAGLERALRQSGSTMPVDGFLLRCLLGCVGALAVTVTLVPAITAVPLALVLGLGLPVMVVRVRQGRRMAAMTAQIPDALDLMARGLRVGHPLNTSIGNVAREMADPIGTEFGIVFDQVSLGEDLVDAIHDFADRVDIEDVRYLAASIGIQHGVGGDLARVVSVLSKVVRGRIAMRRRIKAISSEGRMTGYFLSALPVLMVGFTMITNPSYYTSVADDPLFPKLAAAVVVLTVVNALLLRRLVNFRI
ncbi:type II secretion system F family protein [Frigidibacter sp. MR17.14]|uniref:type II secretion system F family protein n=1 Tax=Frigidibacter sp. MR17.14 TaxID=3126509 RepID=UPI003012FE39